MAKTGKRHNPFPYNKFKTRVNTSKISMQPRVRISKRSIEACIECGSMDTRTKMLKVKCYNCGIEYAEVEHK